MHFASLLTLVFCFCLTSISFGEPALKPSGVLPKITIPSDTELKVFATQKSHGVFSPTALCIDEQGRVLVTETWRFMDNRGIDDNRQRRYWIHEDMAAQTTADRMAMYKKWYPKHPPEHYTRYSEKIRMLTDSNGDGVADKHTIFADGFNDPLDGTAAGIFSYRGDVYFACIPHIWMMHDKDGDGVSDSKKSLQDGFGVRVSFSGHDLNGFAFGPDGRIYATIGDRGFNIKTKEGKHYAYPGQGAILRFEPDGSKMEVIHTGLRNPKEIAFDQFGNPITVDNNSDQGDRARVVYIVEGADSGWRMGHQILHSFHRTAGLEKRPINRWMQEKMWQPHDPKHPNAQPAFILPPLLNLTNGPSGLTYHPGPTAYPGVPGQFLVCNYRGSAAASEIVAFQIANHGAGMKVSTHHIFNKGAAVTDCEYGYDGKLYVSDFINGWKAHRAGRIYTIAKPDSDLDDTVTETRGLITNNFDELPEGKLTDFLAHADMRIRLRAQFALAHQKNTQAFKIAFDDYRKKKNLIAQLHAVWGTGIIARKGGEHAKKAVAALISWAYLSQEPEVKSQIAKCLGEASPYEKRDMALSKLLGDPSPRVQSFAAISLGKTKHRPAFATIVSLLTKNADKDPFLRHACIMGMLGTANESQIAALKTNASPAVRLAAVVALRRLKSPKLSDFLKDNSPHIRDEAIRAIHDLELKPQQAQLAALLDQEKIPSLTPMMQRRLIHSAFRRGGSKNISRVLRASRRADFHIDQRREAIRLLTLWNTPPKIDQSLGRWSPLPDHNDTELIPVLQKQLPALLTADNPLTAELLALSTHHRLKLDQVPPSRLLEITHNIKLPGAARAEALKSLNLNAPAGFDKLLVGFCNDKNPNLAVAALTIHVKRSPAQSNDLIIAATDKSRPLALRQAAWLMVSNTSSPKLHNHLATALTTITQGGGDKACALEITTAASRVASDPVKVAYAAYTKSLDPKNPLSPYLTTLHGGNAKRGSALFVSHAMAQCMRCHTTEKHHDVAMAGPNLAGVAKRGDHMFLLESLIVPNAKVAKGYGEHSSMPPMGSLLKKEEIRDLLAYLATLTN